MFLGPIFAKLRFQAKAQTALWSRLCFRHQRLYSLLDRFRLSTVQDSLSPLPPVTSHPLDGDGHTSLETVSPDKVSVLFLRVMARDHVETRQALSRMRVRVGVSTHRAPDPQLRSLATLLGDSSPCGIWRP